MSKYKKVLSAGPLVIEAVYPAPHPRDSTAVRAGKRSLSSEAQQRMNLKYAHQKLELSLAANYVPGDLLAVFTYDDEHLPESRAEAVRRNKAFWKRLRKARSARNEILKYVYCTEEEHGDKRLHHHAVINSTGGDFAEMQALWPYGLVLVKPLIVNREKNYGSLARYFCKEGRDKVGKRLWSCSQNLEKPEVETFRVPDDTSILPPPGAMVLEDSGDRITEYGHFRYIKFIAQGWERQRKPKAKRNRRRK